MAIKELSRKETALRLRCSEAQVAVFEKQGKLHPRRDRAVGQRTHIWYSVDEVSKLETSWKPVQKSVRKINAQLAQENARGKAAAKVFPMLSEGKVFQDIVIATELDPLLVRELEREWRMTFEDAKREAAKREAAEREREEQRRHERRLDMAEWRKVKLEEIRLAAEVARAGSKKEDPDPDVRR